MIVLGPYAGLSWRFLVRCTPGVLAEQVARALESLRTADSGPTVEYVLVAPRGRVGSLEVGGEVLLTSRSEWELYARLLWHVNVGAVAATTDHVLLHAAAAERDGRAVVLCAPMESGKTTLVAGLVLAGLKYLTDECVALRPDDAWITPYPKALGVDRGSWRVLPSLQTPMPPEAEHLRGQQWQVPPASLREDAVSGGAWPAVVVLPRYDGGATTSLEPVTPGTALIAVLQQTFRLDRQRERDMEVLADLLTRCPAYRLTVGDLDSGTRAVLGVL